MSQSSYQRIESAFGSFAQSIEPFPNENNHRKERTMKSSSSRQAKPQRDLPQQQLTVPSSSYECMSSSSEDEYDDYHEFMNLDYEKNHETSFTGSFAESLASPSSRDDSNDNKTSSLINKDANASPPQAILLPSLSDETSSSSSTSTSSDYDSEDEKNVQLLPKQQLRKQLMSPPPPPPIPCEATETMPLISSHENTGRLPVVLEEENDGLSLHNSPSKEQCQIKLLFNHYSYDDDLDQSNLSDFDKDLNQVTFDIKGDDDGEDSITELLHPHTQKHSEDPNIHDNSTLDSDTYLTHSLSSKSHVSSTVDDCEFDSTFNLPLVTPMKTTNIVDNTLTATTTIEQQEQEIRRLTQELDSRLEAILALKDVLLQQNQTIKQTSRENKKLKKRIEGYKEESKLWKTEKKGMEKKLLLGRKEVEGYKRVLRKKEKQGHGVQNTKTSIASKNYDDNKGMKKDGGEEMPPTTATMSAEKKIWQQNLSDRRKRHSKKKDNKDPSGVLQQVIEVRTYDIPITTITADEIETSDLLKKTKGKEEDEEYHEIASF